MAGIAGIISFNRQRVKLSQLKKMAQAAQFRGKKDIVYWHSSKAVMAQLHFMQTSRLLHRPPLSIVVDARIDNKKEILEKLAITTQAETIPAQEIIFYAYLHWGAFFTKHIVGDYAIAIWDASLKKLLLARDPLGSRSLFYYYAGGKCIFATDIAQILAVKKQVSRLNEGKIAEYMAVFSSNAKETFYKDIFSCPPAYYLQITREKINSSRYWHPDPTARIFYARDEEYTAHFLQLSKNAVIQRLPASHKTAVALSGGLDSSLITAIAASHAPINTYSNVFDELSLCDERRYIETTVHHFGKKIQAHYRNSDDLWPLKEIQNWPMERDYLWSDAYAWLPHHIMKQASNQCDVLLNGQFGDVLFSGSNQWLLEALYRKDWDTIKSWIYNGGIPYRTLLSIAKRCIPRSIRQYIHSHRSPLTRANPGLHPDFIRRTQLMDRYQCYRQRFAQYTENQSGRLAAFLDYSWSEGLTEAKRVHYQHNIAIEFPYFDQRLVEFMLAIPATQLIHPSHNRHIQRMAMRSLLPRQITDRQSKTSFDALMKKGLLDKEKSIFIAILQKPLIVDMKIVKADWLQQQIKNLDQWTDEVFYLWLFFCLELWLQRFHKGNLH